MKTIKKIGLAILMTGLIAVIPNSTFAEKYIRGNGNVEKETRNISSFSAIDVSSAFEIYLTQGNSESLVIEADENIMEYIITEVRGGTLKIYVKSNIRNVKTMKAYISFKMIDKIELSGACNIRGEGTYKFNDLEIGVSGASEINMNFTADKVYLDLSGASDIEFTGSADKLTVDVSGATKLYAQDFEVKECSIDASGASTIKVFATEELSVDASGASTVRYKGKPSVSLDSSGASSIRRY
ncbi:MAG: DUF2807 domain-containing protein [Bacteroidetes bacterium]|nr:DUF2807 domain-containing protein [Bacteroidota bacterium]